MNHTVFQIDPADSRFTDTFARFFTDCGEYELFSDCDTPYFAVFSDIDRTHCTGLLTFLISENESFTEAEVAAFVLPDYRRQGIFTALCGTAYHKIKAQYPDCMLTGIFPDFLKKCALYGGTAYTEYLMMLTAENASMAAPALCTANEDILPDSAACSNIHSTITSSPAKDFNSCNDNFLYETCFSDDEQDFLLYRGEEDEPCAVCSLDYENGFTNLYGVYVDEDCRGLGIGTLLLAHLIPAYFKNHNLPLILNVRSTNTAAMQLYRHCGFEITSSVEFSYFTALPQ